MKGITFRSNSADFVGFYKKAVIFFAFLGSVRYFLFMRETPRPQIFWTFPDSRRANNATMAHGGSKDVLTQKHTFHSEKWQRPS